MNTIKLPLEHTTSINNCDMYYTTGAAYDTESTTIYNDDKTVKIAFVYHVQFAIGTSYYTFRTLNDFCIFLKQLVDYLHDVSNDENEPKLIIWVCNMSHEYAFIKNYLNDFNITKIFGKTRRQPLLIEIGNVIQFREAIGLWGHSAKDISDNWCEQYKKLTGDLDYELIRHSLTDIEKNDSGHSEYDYMKNDVLLLTEMHNHIFREYINENGSIYIPYTVSGLVRLHLKDAAINDESLTEFRERCFSKIDSNITVLKIMNKNIFTNSDDWNLLRTYGFSGGVVGTNRVHVGHVRQHVKCADIESDYPYQMLSKQYPCGKIHVGHEREWKNALNEHKPVFALIAIEKLTAKTEHAFISKHKIVNDNSEIYATRHGNSRNTLIYNGKIVQAENVLLVVNDVDYSIYSDAYDMKNVVCLKCWYFDRYGRLPVWLRKCVAMDYYTKTIIKRKYGKKAQTMISYRDAKSRVNTYFGTLALRPSDVFDSIDDSDYLLKPDHELTFDEMVKNTWLNPYWAFYITSYARKMLIENIIYRPNCVIQYDTDSIYYISNTNDGRELEKHLREFNDNCRHMTFKKLVKR